MTGSVGQTSLSQEKAETPLLTVGLTEKDTGNTTADEGSGSISSPGS